MTGFSLVREVPSIFVSESVAGAGSVLRCDEGGELTAADVAEEPLGTRVEPADDSVVSTTYIGIRRSSPGLFDVTADLQAGERPGV